MNLTLVVSSNCIACRRIENQLKNIKIMYPQISLNVVNINKLRNRHISITPAILVEDELFSYGEFDENKLILKIK